MWDAIADFFSDWKTWAITTFIVSMIAGLWNKLTEFFAFVLDWGLAQVSALGGPDTVVVEYTGLAAWFAIHLKFPECLTIMFTCLSIKWILRKIPVIRW